MPFSGCTMVYVSGSPFGSYSLRSNSTCPVRIWDDSMGPYTGDLLKKVCSIWRLTHARTASNHGACAGASGSANGDTTLETSAETTFTVSTLCSEVSVAEPDSSTLAIPTDSTTMTSVSGSASDSVLAASSISDDSSIRSSATGSASRSTT